MYSVAVRLVQVEPEEVDPLLRRSGSGHTPSHAADDAVLATPDRWVTHVGGSVPLRGAAHVVGRRPIGLARCSGWRVGNQRPTARVYRRARTSR